MVRTRKSLQRSSQVPKARRQILHQRHAPRHEPPHEMVSQKSHQAKRNPPRPDLIDKRLLHSPGNTRDPIKHEPENSNSETNKPRLLDNRPQNQRAIVRLPRSTVHRDLLRFAKYSFKGFQYHVTHPSAYSSACSAGTCECTIETSVPSLTFLKVNSSLEGG